MTANSPKPTSFLLDIGRMDAADAIVFSSRDKAIEWLFEYVSNCHSRQYGYSFDHWMKKEGIREPEAAVVAWLRGEDMRVTLIEKAVDPEPGHDPELSIWELSKEGSDDLDDDPEAISLP